MGAGDWELVGIPYTSAARPGGIADAIRVLRAEGLTERLATLGVADGGDLDLDGPSGERGSSGLLNEPALAELVRATRTRVAQILERGRRPLLVGGDCPVLLGPLAAIRDRRERPGLVMIDGHEDAWPPERSETGEASDSEVAIALGLVLRLPSPLDGLTPLLDTSALAMAGPRDAAEIAEAGVVSIRDRVAAFADPEALRVGGIEDGIGGELAAIDADAVWVHVDLDVLTTAAMPAVDYRQPGGLEWAELDRLAAVALGDPRCRGCSVVIYNPEFDPDRSDARRVVEFLARLVAGLPGRGSR